MLVFCPVVDEVVGSTEGKIFCVNCTSKICGVITTSRSKSQLTNEVTNTIEAQYCVSSCMDCTTIWC